MMIEKIEGIDYSPSGIRSIRKGLIELRDQYLIKWVQNVEGTSDNINATVILTHAIALLTYLEQVIIYEESPEEFIRKSDEQL